MLAAVGQLFAVVALQPLVGVDQYCAIVAVKHDSLAVHEQLGGMVNAGQHGDFKAAGQNGGVRPQAAVFGNESGYAPLAENGHVGRRQFGRHQYGVFKVARFGCFQQAGGAAGQLALHQVDDLLQVFAAQLQIVIVDALKLFLQNLAALRQRPLRVDAFGAYGLAGGFNQHGVMQHEAMNLDELTRGFAAGVVNAFEDARQKVIAALNRLAQAGNFIVDGRGFDGVFGQGEFAGRDAPHLAHGNAGGHAGAGQRQAHSSSPKRLLTRSTMACAASPSSLPSTSSVNTLPQGAASSSMPMMDLALTRLSLWVSQTWLLKRAAVCTSLLAARACKPSRLTSSISSFFIPAGFLGGPLAPPGRPGHAEAFRSGGELSAAWKD